jgi:uncharacterized protein YndB with AHSA1/START domain
MQVEQAPMDTSKRKATIELLSDTELVITRTLNAPPELVFEAMTSAEHVPHWYGCDLMKMVVCEIDLRVGGKWRYVLRMPDGSEHGFHGEYRVIEAPHRLVSTENYEPIGPGHEMVATVTLEEKNGRTLFRNHLVYPTKMDRDGHLSSGMETGMQEAMSRLDDISANLAKARARTH